jgi:ribosome-associated toxin RatA of RatAB toxin-antitoxin module
VVSVKKSALVNFTSQQMYDIVTDIASYPDFLQWCSGSEIIERLEGEGEGETVVARVDINYKSIQQSFTTQNRNLNSNCINMQLYNKSDMFDIFNGEWKFTDLSDDGEACKIEFQLDFSMKSNMLSNIFKKAFSQITNLQVDGFVKRAEQLYR